MAWFYNNTYRSLLIVGAFHASYNATTQSQFYEAFCPWERTSSSSSSWQSRSSPPF